MLKMIHKLHSSTDSSWARWVQQNASIASLTGNLHGHHWETLRSLLPIYRAITMVALANGQTTSFWHDVWDEHDSLAERFPELFSHCRDQELKVQQVFDGGLQRFLTAWQSSMATEQLIQVQEIMEQHQLVDGKDWRRSMMIKNNGELDSSLLYRAMKTAYSEPDSWTKFVWLNKTPLRVKFFAWLLSQERIPCKSTLQRKGIVDDAQCEVCQAADETAAHIIFKCNNASQFWNALGIQKEANWPIEAIKEIQAPSHIPAKYFTTFLLLGCWHI
jgi:hypothetical protein